MSTGSLKKPKEIAPEITLLEKSFLEPSVEGIEPTPSAAKPLALVAEVFDTKIQLEFDAFARRLDTLIRTAANLEQKMKVALFAKRMREKFGHFRELAKELEKLENLL